MTEPIAGIASLDARSRGIFREIVESYLASGEPVGSRTLSRQLPISLSPASIRNVMQDLEALGLVYAPHVSAGRVPTQAGLRLFVDALLEIGDLSKTDRAAIEAQARSHDLSLEEALSRVGEVLSGLSQCAGIVLASKLSRHIKHIEFVSLDAERALVVLVDDNSQVENRIITLPAGLTPSALAEAANYLNHHMRGMTLSEAKERVEAELASKRAQIDALAAGVVEAGLAVWSGDTAGDDKLLIVRGASHLIGESAAAEDLDRIRVLFDDLENKKDLIQLLGLAENANGVRIFIGSENHLFSLSGSSLIVSPYRDSGQKIVGVVGVIGPTRLNYARIIPMVDYTARVMEQVLR
jgi:heat-inducible transcriptional repressor